MEQTAQQKPALRWARGTDPVSQSQLWTPVRPYAWQMGVWRDCMELGARVACVTPNESGKTSTVIPGLGLSWMAAFPGAQVVSTSGVERQIKEQLWPVLKQALSKYPKWNITDDALTITAPGVRGLPGATWKAFTTKDPQAAEGFHDRWYEDNTGKMVYAPLLVIIDEAKIFDNEEMFFAFRRCGPAAWLVMSTPGEDRGPFWDCFNRARNKPWKCHEVTWADCPHLMTGHKFSERQAMIAERGEDDPYVQSMVFGKFFRKGGRVVFDRWECVEFSMSGLVPWKRGPRRGAVDLSGGGDEQVFAVRDGNTVLDLQAFRHKDATDLERELIGCFERWQLRPENITADAGGLGGPIIDHLAARGWPVRRYLGNAAPRDKTRFVDRSSEDHFAFRQLLAERSIALPKDDLLREQMRRRKYDMRNDNSNRIKLESKEDIRRRGEDSPDRLDDMVMLFSDSPAALGAAAGPASFANWGSSRTGSVKDCWIDRTESRSAFSENRFEE